MLVGGGSGSWVVSLRNELMKRLEGLKKAVGISKPTNTTRGAICRTLHPHRILLPYRQNSEKSPLSGIVSRKNRRNRGGYGKERLPARKPNIPSYRIHQLKKKT